MQNSFFKINLINRTTIVAYFHIVQFWYFYFISAFINSNTRLIVAFDRIHRVRKILESSRESAYLSKQIRNANISEKHRLEPYFAKPPISFCPENPIRISRRVPPKAG